MKKRILKRFISAITSFAIVSSVYHCFPNSNINTYSIAPSTTITASDHITAEYDEKSDNPFNKQDDKEVPYDSTRWIQPQRWNTPTINPKDYQGGIMLFFDKIGLYPEYAPGKVQRVYFSLTGATEPVSTVKFHIYYDTRLTVKENSAGEVITTGKAFQDFTTGSAMIEEGKLAFYAYSENTLLGNSSLFTIDFIVPENAEQGELYPIGIAYEDDGIAADTFINKEQDDAGKLQMTYVFTKGIYNGYIKIIGEKKTTTTTTATTTEETTSEATTEEPTEEPTLIEATSDTIETTAEEPMVSEPESATEETTTTLKSTSEEGNTDSTKINVSNDVLSKWAENDYYRKTGVVPFRSDYILNSDGTLSIYLYDEEKNILDVYIIDPETGTGSDKNGNQVNLPQTGDNSIYHIIIILSSLIMIMLGAIAIRQSGVIRKKRDIE